MLGLTMPSKSGRGRLESEGEARVLEDETLISLFSFSLQDSWRRFVDTLRRFIGWRGRPTRACSSVPVRTLLSR